MQHILKNNRGEGHIDTGIKIIIAVVIGALILGGLYALFATVIIPNLNNNVRDMMHYEEVAQNFRYDAYEMSVSSLQYSYDGTEWFSSSVPEYSENAVIKKVLNAVDDNPALAIVVDNYAVYIIKSEDNGAHWTQAYSAGTYSRSTKPIQYSLYRNANGTYGMSVRTFDSRTATSGIKVVYKSNDGRVWSRDGAPWDVF